MICEQPGHLTHSPSGTRLGLLLRRGDRLAGLLEPGHERSAYHCTIHTRLKPFTSCAARSSGCRRPSARSASRGRRAPRRWRRNRTARSRRRAAAWRRSERRSGGTPRSAPAGSRGRARSATRFGIGAAAAQPAEQDVGRRLQVDDEVGRRHVARQQIVEPLIDEQLVVVEIEIREDLVLVEQVVGDRRSG